MRDEFSIHKYNTPMAGFLWERIVGMSGHDEEAEGLFGRHYCRVGRWAVTSDDQGFVDGNKFDTIEAACLFMDEVRMDYEDQAAMYEYEEYDEYSDDLLEV